MPNAEVLQAIESNVPGMHAVRIQADDLETYQAPFPVYGAFFQPARDNAASDSWGVTFTVGETQVTINLVGTTTDVNGTLLLLGI